MKNTGRVVHPESVNWVRTLAEIPDDRLGGDGQPVGGEHTH